MLRLPWGQAPPAPALPVATARSPGRGLSTRLTNGQGVCVCAACPGDGARCREQQLGERARGRAEAARARGHAHLPGPNRRLMSTSSAMRCTASYRRSLSRRAAVVLSHVSRRSSSRPGVNQPDSACLHHGYKRVRRCSRRPQCAAMACSSTSGPHASLFSRALWRQAGMQSCVGALVDPPLSDPQLT